MTKRQIDYIKESIATYDELIRINNNIGYQASKENDMCKSSFYFGKVSAYQDMKIALENLLKIEQSKQNFDEVLQ